MKNKPARSKKIEEAKEDQYLSQFLQQRNWQMYHRRTGICSVYSMTLLCNIPACINFPMVKSLTLGKGLLNTYCQVTDTDCFLCVSLFSSGFHLFSSNGLYGVQYKTPLSALKETKARGISIYTRSTGLPSNECIEMKQYVLQ